MNYKKHYENLISIHGLKNKPKQGYYERHHVLPKSMGGSDEENNLVYLSARCHYLAHYLLFKIHRNQQTSCAFWYMSISNRYKINSISYQVAREHAAKFNSEKRLTKEHKEILVNCNRARKNKPLKPHVKEKYRENIIKLNTGRKLTESHKEAIRLSNSKRKGKRLSEEHKNNISKSIKNVSNHKFEKCCNCDKVVSTNTINRWHNDNCKLGVINEHS
jgi:hypothetical protein